MWKLPEGAEFVLKRLHDRGYQAYVVGGCVRDTLLGRAPKDWDVCTNALPDEMQEVFGDCHVIETGLQHGTLTVMYDHEPYEITTFRVDGAYTDHRHPDEVIFVADVKDDLSRRDFTVNAMAWSNETGLVDAFGGQADLEKRIIRCVGEPERRFDEDALRIMRALRFASVYGFEIDPATSDAIHALKDTLTGVAAERIRVELAKLLCGRGAGFILREYRDVLQVIIPELRAMEGFDQKTPYHAFDVWEHTVRAVENVPPTEVLRLTMLLHDAAKPACFIVDEQGVGHAWGHQAEGARLAKEVLAALRVDNRTRDLVVALVEHHDRRLSADRLYIKRELNRFGPELLRMLLQVRQADDLSKGIRPDDDVRAEFAVLTAAYEAVIAENPCVTVRQLAVNGKDLMAAGLRGKQVGDMLEWLLAQVIDEVLPNDREALLAATKNHTPCEKCI